MPILQVEEEEAEQEEGEEEEGEEEEGEGEGREEEGGGGGGGRGGGEGDDDRRPIGSPHTAALWTAQTTRAPTLTAPATSSRRAKLQSVERREHMVWSVWLEPYQRREHCRNTPPPVCQQHTRCV